MASTTDHGTIHTSNMTATEEALEITSQGNLHQCLWLPETTSHERLRITFSTSSNFSDTSLPTFLFCGPMFGSRWMVLDGGRLAVQNGVRVICTDRPGMGGSTRVPLKIRVQVWLETVPVLLKKLNIKHVSLFCHSTGAIYALNTLYHLRDILDPKAPYVAFIAPWVNNEQSHTALINIVLRIPNGLIEYWNSTIKFMTQRVSPVTSWSAAILSSMTKREGSEAFTFADKYGTTEELGKEIERLKMFYIFQEDTTGVNEDARLCLKKGGPGLWGACEDYAECIRNFIKPEQDRAQSRPNQVRLKIHAYFASSDVMIGKHGQEYFEQIWRQPGVEDFVDFESTTLDKTNHDSVVLDPKNGALESVFKQAHTSRGEDT